MVIRMMPVFGIVVGTVDLFAVKIEMILVGQQI
jgi:hypothetical protein